ncbi:response regulator transcription factor [Marinomonas mediterranea]|nr:helix-turn-helix transcriptional regulator [Marinomonas mediterranea]
MAMLIEKSNELEVVLQSIQQIKQATSGASFNEVLFNKSVGSITKKEVALLRVEKKTWHVDFQLNLSFPPSLLSAFLSVAKEFNFNSEADIKALGRSLCSNTDIDIQDLNNADSKYFTVVAARRTSSQCNCHLIELIMPYLHSACSAASRIQRKSSSPINVLTSREREVLNWISSGKTNGEISMILGISPNTVKNHVASILGKLNAPNRLAATALTRL